VRRHDHEVPGDGRGAALVALVAPPRAAELREEALDDGEGLQRLQEPVPVVVEAQTRSVLAGETELDVVVANVEDEAILVVLGELPPALLEQRPCRARGGGGLARAL
jgi:hypothetical protein